MKSLRMCAYKPFSGVTQIGPHYQAVKAHDGRTWRETGFKAVVIETKDRKEKGGREVETLGQKSAQRGTL